MRVSDVYVSSGKAGQVCGRVWVTGHWRGTWRRRCRRNVHEGQGNLMCLWHGRFAVALLTHLLLLLARALGMSSPCVWSGVCSYS